MKLWGLTGGIGSGKSTASQMFRALGAHVVDADAVYHQLLAPHGGMPSPVAQSINVAFPGVLLVDGRIDRAALGQRIFSDAAARRRLNTLTHPAVADAVQNQMAQWSQEGVAQAIYDVPLLYENGLQTGLDGVAVVWVPEDVQLQRLMQRDGMAETAARQRLAAQLPLDKKRAQATWVIDNSGSLENTRTQVEAIWRAMQMA